MECINCEYRCQCCVQIGIEYSDSACPHCDDGNCFTKQDFFKFCPLTGEAK